MADLDFKDRLERITVVCGHYGSGKTNFSLNLAIDMAKEKNKRITLVDLDIVNPYFRSSDYRELLENSGVHVIAPKYAGTNLDTPALSAEIDSVFCDENTQVIFDVGGDDAGAFALGRYSDKIKQENYSFIYLVNKYRNLTNTPETSVEILGEIMCACGLMPSYIVNNSHLQRAKTAETILNAADYGEKIAELVNVPLLCTTAPDFLKDSERLAGYKLYYVRSIVRPPFYA